MAHQGDREAGLTVQYSGVLISQSLGEYAGASAFDGVAGTVRSAVSWVESSIAHDRPLWIGAVIVVAVLWFFLRRR
jgi:hypothetical protein